MQYWEGKTITLLTQFSASLDVCEREERTAEKRVSESIDLSALQDIEKEQTITLFPYFVFPEYRGLDIYEREERTAKRYVRF